MLDESIPQQRNSAKSKTQLYAFVIASVLCVLFCLVFLVFTVELRDKDFSIELEERINPNMTPVQSLVRLPSIGMSRAWAIVSYRQNVEGQNRNIQVFENCEDLEKVKGIGPKTAESICKWLTFEVD